MDSWKAVDEFLDKNLIKKNDCLEHALKTSYEAGLPKWEVSPEQGQFLYILAKMKNAKRILELGTLGGYSTIWLASALEPDGILISLECDHKCVEVASNNIKYARLNEKVKIIEGNALDSMRKLIENKIEPFDMIFIDADKPNNPIYLELALKLSKKGTIIYGDNIIRNGELANSSSIDPKVIGVRKYVSDLGKLNNVTTSGLQTVGCKGYDGFSLSIVEED